jgi:hypothetical protein
VWVKFSTNNTADVDKIRLLMTPTVAGRLPVPLAMQHCKKAAAAAIGKELIRKILIDLARVRSLKNEPSWVAKKSHSILIRK